MAPVFLVKLPNKKKIMQYPNKQVTTKSVYVVFICHLNNLNRCLIMKQ